MRGLLHAVQGARCRKQGAVHGLRVVFINVWACRSAAGCLRHYGLGHATGGRGVFGWEPFVYMRVCEKISLMPAEGSVPLSVIKDAHVDHLFDYLC